MNPPKFTTLGCRLNAYETEAMKELSQAAGLQDAVIVNTCAVTSEAVRKARQEIRKLRRENPDARLIVTGCAAQTEPDTFVQMAEVDAVVGNTEKMLLDTWKGMAADFIGETEAVQVDDIMSVTETAGHLIDGFGTRSRAYVQVQNGCDHRCTFCIIPYGRGNSRSVPAGVVVDQIKRLVDRGYNEVVLTGVDLTSWGADLPAQPRLGDLVMRILKLVPDLPRLRISSIDSIEVDENLMQAIATEPRLMPHLHLSLQHGDDLILKRMKRRHLRDDAIRFAEDARRLRPEMTFGADIIAGFPTETEAHFENSLKLVADCGLTWLHVFPYSKRPGTPAARIPQQVNGKVIKDRAARLRAVGDAQVERHLAAQVGKVHNILMENAHMGRTEQFTEVTFQTPQAEGQIVSECIKGNTSTQVCAALPLSGQHETRGSLMWNFLAGTVCGVVLSISYVWYGVSLPDWLELPDTFKKSLNAAVVDDALLDPDIPEATRRRALEVYFANQAERAAALEAELGYPIIRALQNRQVKRVAQHLRAQWSGYDAALRQPALRATLSRKHGAADNDTLKRHMLMAALKEEPLLANWLKIHSRTPSASNALEIITEVSRLAATSSCPPDQP